MRTLKRPSRHVCACVSARMRVFVPARACALHACVCICACVFEFACVCVCACTLACVCGYVSVRTGAGLGAARERKRVRPRALAWSRVRLHRRVQAMARRSFIKPRLIGNSVPGHNIRARRARNPFGAELLVGHVGLRGYQFCRVDTVAPPPGYRSPRDHPAGLEHRRARRPSV